MQMPPSHCNQHPDFHKETSEDHMGLSVRQFNTPYNNMYRERERKREEARV